MKSYDVRVHQLGIRKDRPNPYDVRWAVSGKRFRKAFTTRALADNFRSHLMQAVRRGESFDSTSGIPESMVEAPESKTWFEHVRVYADMKWTGAAAKTRVSTADALATITPALVKPDAGPGPSAQILRDALMGWVFNPLRRESEKPERISQALAWLSVNSVALSEFNDPIRRPLLTRAALDACAMRLDGKPAAATTARRKRAVLYNALGYAVEIGELSGNPVDAVQWKAPKVAEEVDRRVVPSPDQVRQLLVAVY